MYESDIWAAMGDKNNEATTASISKKHEVASDNAKHAFWTACRANTSEPQCLPACLGVSVFVHDWEWNSKMNSQRSFIWLNSDLVSKQSWESFFFGETGWQLDGFPHLWPMPKVLKEKNRTSGGRDHQLSLSRQTKVVCD